jgi:hypothetical protein
MKPRHMALVAIVALAGVVGCVPVEGGAIEVSWVVQANGRAITDCSCANPPISKVRIDLLRKGLGDGGSLESATPCAGRAQCEFACQRQTGATPFDIPETKPGETYLISLVPVGAQEQELTDVRVPTAVSRSVVRGQPVELEAFLLQAGCADECGGMNNSGVCARP